MISFKTVAVISDARSLNKNVAEIATKYFHVLILFSVNAYKYTAVMLPNKGIFRGGGEL